jgi:hypothetical protein
MRLVGFDDCSGGNHIHCCRRSMEVNTPNPKLGFVVEFPSDPRSQWAITVPSCFLGAAHIFSVKEDHALYVRDRG